VIALSHLPVETMEFWSDQVRRSIDPIGAVAPLVAGRPLDRQHRSLSWNLDGPKEKHEAVLAPGLLPGEGLTP
jgi:hypothetical protein